MLCHADLSVFCGRHSFVDLALPMSRQLAIVHPAEYSFPLVVAHAGVLDVVNGD